MDAITTTLMGTEEFAKTANIASNLQLRMQKGMANHMSKQLAMFNMPSREDITALGERMMTIDERLVRIEAMLRTLSAANGASAAQPPRSRTPRTKKPAKKAAATEAKAPTKKAPAKKTAAKKTASKKTAKKAAKKTAAASA